MKKKLVILAAVIIIFYFVVVPAAIAVIHGVVMRRYTYKDYDSDRFLLYEDVEEQYPRKTINIPSGGNTLSAYLYGADGDKGVIVVSPGHTDANDIKLYEIRYFADAGYQVLCFDYTGCYTSGGKAFGGYTQAVYDLDAVLTYCDSNPAFEDMPVYLYGHSMGGYASAAVLNYGHRVDAVVSASGFDRASEQWECSVKRFTKPFYFLVRPIVLAFIQIKYGDDKDLSAIDGINACGVPVLVISADTDVFYGGGRSPIYDKNDMVTNERCEFVLMDKPGHNGHYSYFLTDAAVEYIDSDPQGAIDKELYMEHDKAVMDMILGFYEKAGASDDDSKDQ